MRILLVEDDEMNARGGRRLLEKAGNTVTLARDGQEAIERLAGQEFDVILMDVQMPVMDGVEATKRIRASETPHADIPIIAMTAYSMIGDKEKFIAAGMDDYIAKPVELVELNPVIQRVMTAKWKPRAGQNGADWT